MKVHQIDEAGKAVEIAKGRGERQSRTAWVRVKRSQAKGHLGKDRREGSGAKAIGTKLPKGVVSGRHPASAESRGKKAQVAVLLKFVPERTPASIAGEHSFIYAKAMLDLKSQRNHAQ